MVVKKLEQDGLVVRSIGAHDRRRHNLRLTKSGEKLLSRLAGPAQKAKARALSAFSPHEQTLFLQLLDKFTRAFNGTTRVPLDPQRSRQEPAPGTRRSGAVANAAVTAALTIFLSLRSARPLTASDTHRSPPVRPGRPS